MDLPEGWTQAENSLTRTVSRQDFKQAITFVNRVAELAEQADHHPDIRIHRYRQVTLTLTTHAAGNQVTEKDVSLATSINELI